LKQTFLGNYYLQELPKFSLCVERSFAEESSERWQRKRRRRVTMPLSKTLSAVAQPAAVAFRAALSVICITHTHCGRLFYSRAGKSGNSQELQKFATHGRLLLLVEYTHTWCDLSLRKYGQTFPLFLGIFSSS